MPPSGADLAHLEIDGVSAFLRLADPRRRNALGSAMFDAIERHLDELERWSAAGEGIAVAIEAEGSAFCAGFDLREGVESPGATAAFVDRLSKVLRRLRRLDAVVLAAVQGPALAGGAAIVSACDLLLVTHAASIGYPAVRIGVSPAVSLPTLAAEIGGGPARRLMLSGEMLDGAAARRIGWASDLLPDEASLREATRRWVGSIAGKGHRALRETKRWLNRLDGTSLDDAFDATGAASRRTAASPECAARMRQAIDRTASPPAESKRP